MDATEARFGRPRILTMMSVLVWRLMMATYFLVARTESSAFLKPTCRFSSWINASSRPRVDNDLRTCVSSSERSSLDICFSAPRFMVEEWWKEGDC